MIRRAMIRRIMIRGTMNKAMALVGFLSVGGFLLGCQEATTPVQVASPFEKIESADECHLCGMLIMQFPGPKGELFEPVDGQPVARKFCSTRDLFAYYFQPENQHNVKEIYVHDMAQASWEQPGNDHLIDARTAWYVLGSSQQGAMGVTLASFSQEAHAKLFSKNYGGRILAFDQLTLAEVQDASVMGAPEPSENTMNSMHHHSH